MRIMEQKDILTVEDWTEAFSHVGSAAVRDDTKLRFGLSPTRILRIHEAISQIGIMIIAVIKT